MSIFQLHVMDSNGSGGSGLFDFLVLSTPCYGFWVEILRGDATYNIFQLHVMDSAGVIECLG